MKDMAQVKDENIEAAEESRFENELQDISEKIRKNFMVIS